MRLLPRDSGLGWTPFGWLIYLGFLFIDPASTGAAGDWALALGCIVVFLPLYFRAHWLEGSRAVPYVVAIVLLGVVVSPLNGGAVGFFIYAAAFATRLGPPRTAIAWVLGIVAIVLVEHLAVGIGYVWVPAVLFSLLIGGVNIHFAEAARSDARLRLAQEEVEHLAQVNERERIARDLHDLLGHSLSVIALKSELAARLVVRDPGKAEVEMREVETISRQALSEVREAVEGFREASLGAELPRAKLALASARVALEIESGPYALEADREGALALALREAVTNVVRHARARSCRIVLRQSAGWFHLVVQDDGRGGAGAPGSGLTGMRERIEALGGTVHCDSERGWRLQVALPAAGAVPSRSKVGWG